MWFATTQYCLVKHARGPFLGHSVATMVYYCKPVWPETSSRQIQLFFRPEFRLEVFENSTFMTGFWVQEFWWNEVFVFLVISSPDHGIYMELFQNSSWKSSWLFLYNVETYTLYTHGSYEWIIMLEKCRRLDLTVFHLIWVIGTYGNWKNQNPGGRFGATS